MRFYELTPNLVSTFDAELAADWVRQKKTVQTSSRDNHRIAVKQPGDDRQVGFLTVDCEGRDLYVLQGIDWSVNDTAADNIETAHEQDGEEIGNFFSCSIYFVTGPERAP